MPPEAENIRALIDDPLFRRKVSLSARQVIHRMNLPASLDEDLSQIVLRKLLDLSNEDVEKIDNFEAYLSTMIRNEAVNFCITTKKHSHPAIEDVAEDHAYSDQLKEAGRIECDLLLREIRESLDEEEKNLLKLMIVGYNEREMGYRLNISHQAARQRVFRLRQKLRKLLLSK